MRVNSYYDRHRKRRKYLLVATLLVLVAASSISCYWFIHKKPAIAKKQVNQATVNSTRLEANYLFSGTIVLARDVEKYANGDHNQPFSGLATLGNYDARIGILECPITANYDSYENELNNLIFNCKPDWLPYLKQNFQVLNLSSDHLNDQGSQGIADTFRYLSQAGIQTVGTYDPRTLNDDCKAVILPVRLISSNSVVNSANMPVALCSYNYKEIFTPQVGQLESITKWSKLMPTIALLNEGPEYQHTASDQTVTIAHQMIDNGADFVIGNGTHWVQNTEVYKGKLIAYSLGNFIFDQVDYDGRIALNLSVHISVNDDTNVSKWLQLSGRCQIKPEDCLALAGGEQLERFRLNYQFKAIGSYGGDGLVTTLANSKQQADIERLANWQETLQKLGQTY